MPNKNFTIRIDEDTFYECVENARVNKRNQSKYIEILIENDNNRIRKLKADLKAKQAGDGKTIIIEKK